ncbi:MAG: hypothetical protein QXE01_11515 [Sulfolobales archaeon]
MVLSQVFLAMIAFIVGVILISLGILYLMFHNRSIKGEEGREDRKILGESIGFILVGPIPIILRGRGKNTRSVLIPIIITMALAITLLVILTIALISII